MDPLLPDYRGLFDLTGKVAVVTGACGILGQHFCSALASHGATVAAVDLDAEAAARLAADLTGRFGTPAIGLACDVSRPDAVAEGVERVCGAFGRIDVLHNNAASKSASLDAFFEPAETFALETWREVMATNLDGMFLMAQAAGRRMVEQGGGSIIQTASIYGVVAPDPRIYEGSSYMGRPINTPPVYSASKAGVLGLTRHLAALWAPHGVRVNTLTPGGVESGQNDAFRERYGARVPLGRMAKAAEMVGALVWLASDASSYVTGQNIIVDGGLTAW
ncbi:SDR family oxidoreductase [Azospirillum thermophilum]|uniref:Short-chain dehydrogenase n=1 Tax=Azospirillum thermophilum TaxID=2202148 RepID=A0A2S2D0I3_9PROT|nr:SDR family oxidoreductase [Azospirillum thermophilum]AWK90252.1 short-chain dehydrogenase [Azospirillum thermophilum]